MQIRYMNATFGALEQAELKLQDGLNVIYAPNESGKSTWSRFIRSMLYGINTRDRSALADKNRFAPWSGTPMGGRMDVISAGESYTLLRQTRRAASPMGEFSCTYAGTDTAVPGITGINAGEQLLGITQEVFARSAFIGQSALAVDQDAELERRIAALITTGEEETSYSETCERLKKQLNRRRHNKTGQIPALEREIGELDESLRSLEDLRGQYSRTNEQMTLLRDQQKQLVRQQKEWDQLDRIEVWDQYRQVCDEIGKTETRLAALKELAGPLPDEATLAQLENHYLMLSSSVKELQRAAQAAEIAAGSAHLAQRTYQEHPLYPADEEGLRDRFDRIVVPESPPIWPFALLLALAACGLAAAVITAVLRAHPAVWIAAAVAALGCGALALLWRARRNRTREMRQQRQDLKAMLTEQMADYLPLRKESAEATAQAADAENLYQVLRRHQEEGTASLLAYLEPYRAASSMDEAVAALGELRRQKAAVDDAERSLRELKMRQDVMRQHLPEGEVPDLSQPIPQPAMDRAMLRPAMAQAEANLRASQSRLDTLAGQIRSMGDPDDLISRRRQKQEQVERLQEEYDAISLAMDALENANLTLENRFSPALGARAAEIFSGITGGKYDRVLLGRDFSLAAEETGDTARRSIQLLSQGATDQLYLSVRLAICDMVLPRDKSVPLVMDDALLTFDDGRLHAALEYLLKESANRQILLFTCQRREADYLAGRENVHLIEL
ncbi:MAG: AAA family ATPase [Oscillospiraceae bacterium]|nr:AAA family ATPase [Oscillospiraceae bacterium]